MTQGIAYLSYSFIDTSAFDHLSFCGFSAFVASQGQRSSSAAISLTVGPQGACTGLTGLASLTDLWGAETGYRINQSILASRSLHRCLAQALARRGHWGGMARMAEYLRCRFGRH